MPWWAGLLIGLGIAGAGIILGALIGIGWMGSRMFRNW